MPLPLPYPKTFVMTKNGLTHPRTLDIDRKIRLMDVLLDVKKNHLRYEETKTMTDRINNRIKIVLGKILAAMPLELSEIECERHVSRVEGLLNHPLFQYAGIEEKAKVSTYLRDLVTIRAFLIQHQ